MRRFRHWRRPSRICSRPRIRRAGSFRPLPPRGRGAAPVFGGGRQIFKGEGGVGHVSSSSSSIQLRRISTVSSSRSSIRRRRRSTGSGGRFRDGGLHGDGRPGVWAASGASVRRSGVDPAASGWGKFPAGGRRTGRPGTGRRRCPCQGKGRCRPVVRVLAARIAGRKTPKARASATPTRAASCKRRIGSRRASRPPPPSVRSAWPRAAARTAWIAPSRHRRAPRRSRRRSARGRAAFPVRPRRAALA